MKYPDHDELLDLTLIKKRFPLYRFLNKNDGPFTVEFIILGTQVKVSNEETSTTLSVDSIVQYSIFYVEEEKNKYTVKTNDDFLIKQKDPYEEFFDTTLESYHYIVMATIHALLNSKLEDILND